MIIKAILSGILLAVSSLTVKIYFLRKIVWQNEFHLGGIVSYMFSGAKWMLRFIFLLTIYNMFRYGSYLDNGIALFGQILPMIILKINHNKEKLGFRLDTWFRKKRASRFLSCPQCNESKVFFRKVSDVDSSTPCYFLITDQHQQVYLGIYDYDQIARDFIEEVSSFEKLVSHYYPHLQPNESSGILVEGEQLNFDDNCYCAKCSAQINNTPIQYGFVDF